MGNNKEIRQRMETCRTVLLVLVWVGAIAGVIGGGVMANEHYLQPFGIALIIVAILGGIIGHFLVNVCLAIPFILLNNGDYLAAIVPEGKQIGINENPVEKQKEARVEPQSNSQPEKLEVKKCRQCHSIFSDSNVCPKCGASSYQFI